MASPTQISNAIAFGQAYFVSLLDIDTANSTSGFPVINKPKRSCLKSLINALSWDLAGGVNDSTTTAIYELLLNEIGSYSGATLVIDPNVIIPGTTIIVNNGSGTNFNQSGKIFFNNVFSFNLPNYNSVYYPLYGNSPDFVLVTEDTTNPSNPIWQQDTSTVPVFTYATPGDATTPLVNVTWVWGGQTSGYIVISGLKPTT